MNKDIFENVGDKNMIETPIELLNATNSKVLSFLKSKFPDFVQFDEFVYTIQSGSTQVMILIRPFTEDDTVVEFISNVVFDANVTPNLMQFLLRKNAELHFGAFGLLFDNTIIFTYSIAGKNLDENEFINALSSVAIISDYYDNEIVKMAGGKTAIEFNEVNE